MNNINFSWIYRESRKKNREKYKNEKKEIDK